MVKGNICLSLGWIYSSLCFPLAMESDLTMVNLSDFSCSALTLSIKSLQIISFLEFLLACLGLVVCEFAAVLWVMSSSVFCWGSLLHFLFTCFVLQSFFFMNV